MSDTPSVAPSVTSVEHPPAVDVDDNESVDSAVMARHVRAGLRVSVARTEDCMRQRIGIHDRMSPLAPVAMAAAIEDVIGNIITTAAIDVAQPKGSDFIDAEDVITVFEDKTLNPAIYAMFSRQDVRELKKRKSSCTKSPRSKKGKKRAAYCRRCNIGYIKYIVDIAAAALQFNVDEDAALKLDAIVIKLLTGIVARAQKNRKSNEKPYSKNTLTADNVADAVASMIRDDDFRGYVDRSIQRACTLFAESAGKGRKTRSRSPRKFKRTMSARKSLVRPSSS